MKSVLVSIQPKWVEKIASGEKTIEVRKTRPKQEVPFKVYIYCTQGDALAYPCLNHKKFEIHRGNNGTLKGRLLTAKERQESDHLFANGKVIGEFICDRIEDFYCCSVPYQKENNLGYGHFVDNGVYKVNGWFEGIVFERKDRYIDSMLKNNDLKEMCLSAQEIFDYIGMGKTLYGWHISNLKIYDKPKELSEFKRPCNKEHDCGFCIRYDYMGHKCFDELTRPPQSWCYVEEL